jgi:hypothetical protein
MLKNDPSAYLFSSNDLTGADAHAKQEIQQLMKGLFFQLD